MATLIYTKPSLHRLQRKQLSCITGSGAHLDGSCDDGANVGLAVCANGAGATYGCGNGVAAGTGNEPNCIFGDGAGGEENLGCRAGVAAA